MKMPDGQVLQFKVDGLTINVEAKELVLCKNCKHYDNGENESDAWEYCMYWHNTTDADGYCYMAEREEK